MPKQHLRMRVVAGLRDIISLANAELIAGEYGAFHPSQGARKHASRDVEAAIEYLRTLVNDAEG